VLDLVFSVDSIITAVGMTPHLPIMVVAVVAAVTVMLVAATPLANFIEKNPTIVMLALGFLMMIGTTLIAEGMGFHVPKGYVYAAMAFSALVEVLNMLSRNKRQRAPCMLRGAVNSKPADVSEAKMPSTSPEPSRRKPIW
jgi:predicted tellurium resistance membrane protein TerC